MEKILANLHKMQAATQEAEAKVAQQLREKQNFKEQAHKLTEDKTNTQKQPSKTTVQSHVEGSNTGKVSSEKTKPFKKEEEKGGTHSLKKQKGAPTSKKLIKRQVPKQSFKCKSLEKALTCANIDIDEPSSKQRRTITGQLAKLQKISETTKKVNLDAVWSTLNIIDKQDQAKAREIVLTEFKKLSAGHRSNSSHESDSESHESDSEEFKKFSAGQRSNPSHESDSVSHKGISFTYDSEEND